MPGDEKNILDKTNATPEPQPSWQDASDANIGTDSVTNSIREKMVHEQEKQARKETLLLQQKACREVEDYINHYLLNTM